MNTIIGELGKSAKFMDLLKQIENKTSPIAISGLTDVGMLQIGTAIHEFGKKPICIVTYNEIQAKKLYEDIKYFTDNVVLFPKKEIVTYDYVAESKELPYQRIEALNEIKARKNLMVITTIEAIMQKLPSQKTLYNNELSFKIGDIHNLEEVKQKLIKLGYVRCDLIEGRGQFAIRGGIVDIANNETIGVRIEFWGDEVDSIRSFNITSQRSIHTLEKANIYPAHEYILENTIENICKKIEDMDTNSKQRENIEEDIEQIKAGNYISKIDKYFDSFYEKQETVLDYLSSNYSIFLEENGKIKQRATNISIDNKNLIKALIEKEKIVPDAINNLVTYEEIEGKLAKKQVIYIEKQDTQNKLETEKYKFEYREVNYYKSEIENLIEDLQKAVNQKKKVYMLVSSKEKAKKLQSLLNEKEIINKIEEKLNQTIIVKANEAIVTITIGKLSAGFESYELKELVIVAEDLIDGEKRRRKITNTDFKEGEKVVFADLKIGDYVVHRRYGIGIYIGVNTIKADGTIKDYIKIKYKNDDILYIPTSDLDSIRKYIGGDVIQPKINSLGSKDWEKTKTKVKNNLREVAKELIELYAKREKAQGFCFSEDTPWQNEFEAKFPYQETEDQLRCIEEVKKDMEMAKPMDRLLCGDVGYGKTEVALRAAFKAVMDQKQVAYLAPTTVLAEQQYQEFKERMKDFPIKVEILNRFKSKKYQDEVIRKLKLGEVDIVIRNTQNFE